jgi:hypothetical protein
VTGLGRIGGGGECRGKWMRRGRKNRWEGEQWRRRESEEGKNRGKRIVMVKLVIQE